MLPAYATNGYGEEGERVYYWLGQTLSFQRHHMVSTAFWTDRPQYLDSRDNAISQE